MSQPAPQETICAHHPGTAAAWVCGRCGSFFCEACARRTRPEAFPMCPGCWELRAKVAPPAPKAGEARLQNVGLLLGVLGLIPMCWWGQIAAIVVNIVGIVKATQEMARAARWRSIVGLVLGCVGLLATLFLLFRPSP